MALAENVIRKIHKLGLIPKAVGLLPQISFLFAVSSLVWLLTLPQSGNFRNCYISENALMPSQVHSYFRESEWNIVRGYREEVAKLEHEQDLHRRNQVISEWLLDLGLQVSYHEDTMYAIMHAPRGENTEAMALVVPWINSDSEFNEGGMSLGVALMRYFQRISVWSKNIILVIPPDGARSLRSWVEAYHTTLDDTAGSIEAAIVVEYGKQGDYFAYYDMFYEGLNGQLPNLDLLNTANLISHHEGISCSLQGISGKEQSYENRLKTLFKGIFKLVTAGLTDVHGHEAFSGWQIQAFTIKARGNQGHDVTQFGRIIDSTFRSVNNLLEKFHQSFFFYLMLSPKHFVSIGTYLPAAVTLALTYAIGFLDAILNSKIDLREIPQHLTKLLMLVVIIETSCVVTALVIPQYSVELFQPVSLALSVVGGVIVSRASVLNRTMSYFVIALGLLIMSLLIAALLIVHFALAFTLGLLALPLTFLPTLIRKNRVLAVLCLVVSNPFLILYVGGVFIGYKDVLSSLIQAWADLQSWTWFIFALGWFPVWLMIAYASITLIFEPQSPSQVQQPPATTAKSEKSN
ncbi:uncharacterized protein LODBEIA_P54620 [Lodderomyces beijingensis]|uniref:GPI transamidase component GAA1 n=1 Tax=Lodderomyces beijingensis TaxID=1775926 RepID=A0ABP0ZUA2_9ASCO